MTQEWQPARIVPVHGLHKSLEGDPALRKVVRIRKISYSKINSYIRMKHAERGCNTEEWFSISLEDCPANLVVCEHEVLSD